MKKIVLFVFLFLSVNLSNAQCAYTGLPLTQAGGTVSFCIDSSNTQTVTGVTAGQYVLVNVISGFNYTFSINNVFGGANENLTILNAATNSNTSPSAFNSSASGASINWTATLSGQIKVLFSGGSCTNDGSGSGTITCLLNTIGNNIDSQVTFGTDNWVGHIYNWSGSTIPGGSTSPNAPANTTPFSPAEYAGYYTIATETIAEGFGGDKTCIPVTSAGSVRGSIYGELFAVRYRMRSTKTGCYLVNFRGDDGIRLYVDGALVFSQWQVQAPTAYNNVLVYLNGNSDLILDYYENQIQNEVNFSMTPFAASSNTITPAAVSVCTGVSPGLLDGSAYTYTGATTNPSILYQWQSSTDNSIFTDISGATTEDYTPPAQTTTTTNIVRYYRRVVKARAAGASSCVFYSNSSIVTTSASSPPTSGTISGSTTQCANSTNQSYTATIANAVRYAWTLPAGWSVASGSSLTSNPIIVNIGVTGGNLQVTATNGCGTSGAIVQAVTVGGVSTWNGTTWNTAPALDRSAIFAGNYSSAAAIQACNCTINTTRNVTVLSGGSMTIQDFVNIAGTGTLTLENNAPLVQINDGAVNSGTITVKRNSSALMRLDYTLWSSPVTSLQTLLSFSPLTFNSGPSNIRFYTYNTAANFYASLPAATTKFDIAKGYLIRMPNNHPTTPTVWTGIFTGTPNNGVITTPISYVSPTQLFNTVGNPYPSPIDMAKFVTANTANIGGTLRFWRKTNTNTGNTGYSTWNGGIFVQGPNFSASSNPGGILQTGQGFMVDAKLGASSVVFNNAMRIVNTANQFFKSSTTTKNTPENPIFDFVWLNLLGTTEQNSQAAVGYRASASNLVDDFDAEQFNDAQIAISSLIDSKGYVIQSRSPLVNMQEDVIPLRVKVPNAGTFVIAIDRAEGQLHDENTTIYLKDKANSLLIDLKQSSYSFTSEAGTVADRFELLINKKGTETSDISSSFAVYKEATAFVLQSGLQSMAAVKVYDLLGRLLLEKNNLNTKELRFDATFSDKILIIKATFTNGEEAVKKVVN